MGDFFSCHYFIILFLQNINMKYNLVLAFKYIFLNVQNIATRNFGISRSTLWANGVIPYQVAADSFGIFFFVSIDNNLRFKHVSFDEVLSTNDLQRTVNKIKTYHKSKPFVQKFIKQTSIYKKVRKTTNLIQREMHVI